MLFPWLLYTNAGGDEAIYLVMNVYFLWTAAGFVKLLAPSVLSFSTTYTGVPSWPRMPGIPAIWPPREAASMTSPGLYFHKSTDDGNTWSAANKKLVSNGWFNDIAVQGTNVYVSYVEGPYDLYFAKSADSGANW